MLPDRVSNPGPLTYESGALPIALRGPANATENILLKVNYPFFSSAYMVTHRHSLQARSQLFKASLA